MGTYKSIALVTAALAVGCGDDGGGATVDAAPAVDASADQPGFQPARVGYISLVEGGGFDSVFASIRDRSELPEPTLIASDGDCAIYVHPPAARCEPACTDGFCVANDQCEPWPQIASAGPITVTGLTDPLTFEPSMFGYTPDAFPGEDMFDAGSRIVASAPGDASDAFTLETDGVSALEATFPVTLELEDDVDEVIAWTPRDDARIQLALQVGWHGAPYEALLLCETEDDGELTVPGGLISRFPRASNGMEQHFSSLTRFTRAVAQTPAGPVELFVGDRVIITQISHP